MKVQTQVILSIGINRHSEYFSIFLFFSSFFSSRVWIGVAFPANVCSSLRTRKGCNFGDVEWGQRKSIGYQRINKTVDKSCLLNCPKPKCLLSTNKLILSFEPRSEKPTTLNLICRPTTISSTKTKEISNCDLKLFLDIKEFLIHLLILDFYY